MDSNYVEFNDVVEIKEDQIALIASKECNEVMVLLPAPREAFGFKALISNGCDLEIVKNSLTKMGFTGEIVEIPLNYEDEAYVCHEGFSGGKALCVKEFEENNEKHLKLCVVLVKEKKLEEENYLEM